MISFSLVLGALKEQLTPEKMLAVMIFMESSHRGVLEQGSWATDDKAGVLGGLAVVSGCCFGSASASQKKLRLNFWISCLEFPLLVSIKTSVKIQITAKANKGFTPFMPGS